MATARSLVSRSPSVDTPPDLPWPRKSKAITPATRFSLLATFQTAPCCQDKVKPWASTIARSVSAGRCMASIGTPSSVTSVLVLSTGWVISPLCVTWRSGRAGSPITGGCESLHRADWARQAAATPPRAEAITVQIGVQIPDFTFPDGPVGLGADLAAVGRAADEAGFDFIAVMDHFFQIPVIGPPEREMLEAYSTLAFLAGVTSQVKLLTLVTGTVYRHPGILAKTVTTLDVLSGGRAWLGIGAA